MKTERRSKPWIALVMIGSIAASCGPAETGADDFDLEDADANAITWVTPVLPATIAIDEIVELAVSTHNVEALAMRFTIDGTELAVCDPRQPEEDCHRDDLWRWTTTFTAGHHTLRASFQNAAGETVESVREIDVLAQPPADNGDPEGNEDEPDPTLEDELVDEGTGANIDEVRTDRGFLDPNRASHSIFGSYAWSVQSQRVVFPHYPLDGSVSAVARCMDRYGTSIRRYGDARRISRASIVAMAITESNCTNPAGSSDGLSSGPMQVTGSTCSALTGLSRTECRRRMHGSADFSFDVGTRYIASAYQHRQHQHDPPLMAAAYNAGSLRRSRANHWHLVSTGNHIDRFVAAYNAYRTWERRTGAGPENPPANVNEPEPTVSGGTAVTGYVSGRAVSIRVTTINGKPVEVATAAAYLRMRTAAARDGVNLYIVSGFRTMAEQQRLYQLYLSGRGNLAARPGYSNHQSGHALDLNASAPGVYNWLANRGGGFGFRRTVPSENWHWEFWN